LPASDLTHQQQRGQGRRQFARAVESGGTSKQLKRSGMGMFDRSGAAEFSSGDIGPCCGSGGGCGRAGNREFKRLIEATLALEWHAAADEFYCPVHTDLVVDQAVESIRAHREFLRSDVLTDD
jgi:hypothetical protein